MFVCAGTTAVSVPVGRCVCGWTTGRRPSSTRASQCPASYSPSSTLKLSSPVSHQTTSRWRNQNKTRKTSTNNRPAYQIPQCTSPIFHNAPFWAEMCICLHISVRVVHCGIFDVCGVVRWVDSSLFPHISPQS